MFSDVLKQLRVEAEKLSPTNAQMLAEWRERGGKGSKEAWKLERQVSGQRTKEVVEIASAGASGVGVLGIMGVAMANQAASTVAMYAGLSATQTAAVSAAGLATSAGTFTTMMAGVSTALSGLGTVAIAGATLPAAPVIALGVAAAGAAGMLISKCMSVDWSKGHAAVVAHDQKLNIAELVAPDGHDSKLGALDWLRGAKNLVARGIGQVFGDRGPQVENRQEQDVAQLEERAVAVMRTAKTLGLRADIDDVLDTLTAGHSKDGTFVGEIREVDQARGVAFQSTGRGECVVHSLAALNRMPQVGEMAYIQVRDGRGTVLGRGGQEQSVER